MDNSPFSSPSMAAMLTLGTYNMAMEAELEQDAAGETGRSEAPLANPAGKVAAGGGRAGAAAGAGDEAAEAQGMVAQLAGLIAGLQVRC